MLPLEMELRGWVSVFRFGIPIILSIHIFYCIIETIVKLKQNSVPVFHSSLGCTACLLHNLLGEIVPAPVLLCLPRTCHPSQERFHYVP